MPTTNSPSLHDIALNYVVAVHLGWIEEGCRGLVEGLRAHPNARDTVIASVALAVIAWDDADPIERDRLRDQWLNRNT